MIKSRQMAMWLVLAFTVVSVAACGPSSEDGAAVTPDKDAVTKSVAVKTPAPVELTPAPKPQVKAWTYDPSVAHDPFQVPELTDGGDGPGEGYALEQMALIGVIVGNGMSRALVQLPNNTELIVRVNDTLGRQQGEVTEIGSNYLIVEQSYFSGPGEVSVVEKILKM